jgi:hypothetical protein
MLKTAIRRSFVFPQPETRSQNRISIGGLAEMAGIQRFSSQVIDYAERLSGMADAAEGKHQQTNSKMTRWVLLPASGAALYALVRSDFFSRRAKDVMGEAKTRASELPDDLMARVKQSGQRSSAQNGSQRRTGTGASRTRSSSARRTSSSRKRSSARKTASASR